MAKAEGEAAQKAADAGLKQAKTQETVVKAQVLANTPPEAPSGPDPMVEEAKAAHEMDLEERRFERDTQLKFMEFGLRRQEMAVNAQLKAQESAEKRAAQRAEQHRAAASSALRTPQQS